MTQDHCRDCPAYIKGECIGVALYGGRSGGRKPIWKMDYCPRDMKRAADMAKAGV